MTQSKHVERHFTAGETIRDIVLGVSDGLTVPFALAAGLSGAAVATHIIVTAGLAEIAAGAISMGLGGYLSARVETDHYVNERKREEEEILVVPETEMEEVTEIFQNYGIQPADSLRVVNALRNNPKAWVDFMMRFELGLEKPALQRARNSGMTIGGSYVVGGLIPILPYFITSQLDLALQFSVLLTLFALGIFGFIKSRLTGVPPLRGALQTIIIGGIAAIAAFLLARVIQ